MDEDAGAFNMAQKVMAHPRPLGGSLNQAGDIDQDKTGTADLNKAQNRLQDGKWEGC